MVLKPYVPSTTRASRVRHPSWKDQETSAVPPDLHGTYFSHRTWSFQEFLGPDSDPKFGPVPDSGVSINGGSPKWLVYNGQSQSKMGWFRGTPISGNHSIPSNISTVLWPSHTTHHYPRLSTSDAASQRLIRAAFCQDQKWPQNVASAAATVPGCTRLYQVPLGWTPPLVFLGENRQTDGGNP